MDKRVRVIRAEWVGDDTDYPIHLGNGALFVLVQQEPQDEPGLYLPNGQWHAVPGDEKPRMGF